MTDKVGYLAKTKFVIVSPKKVRSVARVVARKQCSRAIAILDNMPQKGARLLGKTLKSAVANALDRNANVDEDLLFIKEIRVDEGPRLKRVWFRARGRADRLLKRMCHITVVVDEKRGK